MTNYFSKNLKYLREKKKIDQQEMADNLNIPRSTLSCWENGIRTPKIEQIQDIAKYFNVDIDIISRDYSDISDNIEKTKKDEREILFDKSKKLISDDDWATIEFIMNKTIKNYEEKKNNEK